MNAEELSGATAAPIQVLGMSFYFDPPTKERARELGLNVFEFYGLGRAGVLGHVDNSVVDRAFTFFHPDTITALWDSPLAKADPISTAAHYVEAAYAFADRTFGELDETDLANFATVAFKVIANVPLGRHLLVDGYRQYGVPENAVHAAYLGTILLRELRGGAHIDAVHQVGLAPHEAAYLESDDLFKLHGYAEADVPVVTPELEAKKFEAEAVTARTMAEYFSVLGEVEREQLAAGTFSMFAALGRPVQVSRRS